MGSNLTSNVYFFQKNACACTPKKHFSLVPQALKMTRCESIDTTIRKRRLFFAGGVARQSKERLPSRVMVGTIAGVENLRPGGQSKTWHRCIVEDLKEFRATEGSTEVAPLVFGVETALWSTAAEEAGTG